MRRHRALTCVRSALPATACGAPREYDVLRALPGGSLKLQTARGVVQSIPFVIAAHRSALKAMPESQLNHLTPSTITPTNATRFPLGLQ